MVWEDLRWKWVLRRPGLFLLFCPLRIFLLLTSHWQWKAKSSPSAVWAGMIQITLPLLCRPGNVYVNCWGNLLSHSLISDFFYHVSSFDGSGWNTGSWFRIPWNTGNECHTFCCIISNPTEASILSLQSTDSGMSSQRNASRLNEKVEFSVSLENVLLLCVKQR